MKSIALICLAFFTAGVCYSQVSPTGGKRVISSPDNACELVVIGDGPGGAPGGGEEQAFIQMASGGGGAVGQKVFTFAALGTNSPIKAFWSPDSRYLALVIEHPRYHDLMIVGRALTPVSKTQVAVSFVSVKVPLLPAGGILDTFPRAGKPPGRQFKLDTMSIKQITWSADSRGLAIQNVLGLIDTPQSKPGPAYHYVVDDVVTMPANYPVYNNGGEADLRVVNVAFEQLPGQ